MEKKLNVLVITNLFPNSKEPNRGIFIKQSTIELARLCDVRVIAPVPWFPLKGAVFAKWSLSAEIPHGEEIDGIKTYHPRWVVIPKILRSLYGFLFFFSIVPLIRRVRATFDFDVILAPWVYPDGFASVLAAKVTKRPVVLQALGCDVNLYAKYFLRRHAIQWALRNADKTIAVSRPLKENVERLGVPETSVVYIPNGVDTTVFKPMNQLDCRKKLHLDARKKIILFVGSLEEVKGVRYLMDAMKDLAGTPGMDVHLLMIGAGNLRTELEKSINELSLQDKITLVGEIPHQDLPTWINASDLFCLPSIREGMPNVVLEALACRKPVIATRVGALPDMITSEDFGVLVEPRSPGALKDAFIKMLQKNDRVLAREKKTPVITWQEQAGMLHAQLAEAARAWESQP
jgi:teichuronic acid biosynthesis glycosyltransferase TuaC